MSKRFWIHRPDSCGQSYHRAFLPVKHCAPILAKDDIDLVCEETLSDFTHDVYIFHRHLRPEFLPVIDQLQKDGRKVVWELDDDLWNIPEWNPSSRYANDPMQIDCINFMRDKADQIIVSTDDLARVVARPDKTVTLPNLVDLDDWQEKPKEPHEEVRIVWAGSSCHGRDIDEVAWAADRLVQEYGDRVLFLFWGDIPDSMSSFVRIRYSHLGMLVPHPRYERRVGLIQMVPLEKYPETLLTLNADIGIAPLCSDPFNNGKSNLKYLEYSAAGIPTVATNMPPYKGTDALLVQPGRREGWYEALKKLIDNPELRHQMARDSQAFVQSWWSWQGYRRDLWVNYFRSVCTI